jgi:teichuronic acid exporter
MVIASGTLIAQVIGLVLAPILTRLYTPEVMGEFSVYFRIVTFIGTVATARYELSIPLPKSDFHSFQIYRMSLRIALITTLITCLGVFIYLIFNELTLESLFMGVTVVAGIFFLVFFNLGTSWAIRIKAFRHISFSKIANSGVMNLLRVGFGFFAPNVFSLIVSFVVSFAIGSIFFLKDFMSNAKLPVNRASSKKMRVLSKIYIDFPRVNLPHALTDTARDVILAMLVVEYFSTEVYGSFDHSLRMLRLPLILIGAAIGQVFYNKATELKNQYKPMLPFVNKTFFVLSCLSLLPFMLIFFWGKPIFTFVFGSDWALSGQISEVIAPWLMLNFIASPFTFLPLIFNEQKHFFVIGLAASAFQIICFSVLPFWMGTKDEALMTIFWILSITQIITLIYTIQFIRSIVKQWDRSLGSSS